MGVPGFTEWFLKTFPRTVTKVGTGKVPADHVFIDFNQFVHKVSRSSRNYNALWKKLYRELDTILNITNPRQSVYIVMDGPGTAFPNTFDPLPPFNRLIWCSHCNFLLLLELFSNICIVYSPFSFRLNGTASRAKLIEQRKHRKTKKPSTGGSGRNKIASIVDRRSITPGCRFTGQILDALSFFVCQRLASRKYEHVKFYVSGANVAGEGELKIMKYISNMPESMRTSDSFALVGSDADLVLLAIASRVPHVHILNSLSSSSMPLIAAVPSQANRDQRQPQGSRPSYGSKSETFVEIGIDKLIQEFSKLVPNTNSRDVGTDFVALSIMSGNDYLPKVPYFFVKDYWAHYIRARKTVRWAQTNLIDPQTNRLNLEFLDSLLSNAQHRPLAQPPIHHLRKLAKLRQLRADLASGKLNREDIIKRYTPILGGAGGQTVNRGVDGEEDELIDAALLSDEGSENLMMEEDDLLLDDEDVASTAATTTISTSNIMMDVTYTNKDGTTTQVVSGSTTQITSARPHHGGSQTASSQNQTSSSMDIAPSSSNGEKPKQPIHTRHPIDIFLDLKSRDSWKDYDADDHASQFVYGLEWVVNSYLSGECVNNDWFFPYSSAPGPTQLRDWIAKAKVNPNIVKALPLPVHQQEGSKVHIDQNIVLGSQVTSSSSSSVGSIQSSTSVTTACQPWMIALMLLDSTAYKFLSPAIPTHLIAPGSYVHEVHDTSYFYAFVDLDLFVAELSQLNVPPLTPEEQEYSYLGNLRMYERSWDNRGTHFLPTSPFDDSEPTHRFHGGFRRLSVPDLRKHHNEALKSTTRQQHYNDRSSQTSNPSSYKEYHPGNTTTQIPIHSDTSGNQHRSTEGKSQGSDRISSSSSSSSSSSQSSRHQNQPKNQSQRNGTGQQHSNRSTGSNAAAQSSTVHSSSSTSRNQQRDQVRQYHDQSRPNNHTNSKSQQNHDRRSETSHEAPKSKRPAVVGGGGDRGRGRGAPTQQPLDAPAPAAPVAAVAAAPASVYGKRMEVDALFGNSSFSTAPKMAIAPMIVPTTNVLPFPSMPIGDAPLLGGPSSSYFTSSMPMIYPPSQYGVPSMPPMPSITPSNAFVSQQQQPFNPFSPPSTGQP
jgi:hypothetical protein